MPVTAGHQSSKRSGCVASVACSLSRRHTPALFSWCLRVTSPSARRLTVRAVPESASVSAPGTSRILEIDEVRRKQASTHPARVSGQAGTDVPGPQYTHGLSPPDHSITARLPAIQRVRTNGTNTRSPVARAASPAETAHELAIAFQERPPAAEDICCHWRRCQFAGCDNQQNCRTISSDQPLRTGSAFIGRVLRGAAFPGALLHGSSLVQLGPGQFNCPPASIESSHHIRALQVPAPRIRAHCLSSSTNGTPERSPAAGTQYARPLTQSDGRGGTISGKTGALFAACARPNRAAKSHRNHRSTSASGIVDRRPQTIGRARGSA